MTRPRTELLQLCDLRGSISLLGEPSSCSSKCRIKHEVVLLMLLHSSGWREILGCSDVCECTLQKCPDFTLSLQGEIPAKGKECHFEYLWDPKKHHCWIYSSESSSVAVGSFKTFWSQSCKIKRGGPPSTNAAWAARPSPNPWVPALLCFANRYQITWQKMLKEVIQYLMARVY